MEVCRLCLDLVVTQGEAKLLDGKTRSMVQVVAPELNLEASKEPHACVECERTLTRLFEFKSLVFEREGEVRAAVGVHRGQLGLKEALGGGDVGGASSVTDPDRGDVPTPNKAEDRVCRTCLAPIECESFTVLRPSEPDAYLSSMLDVCLVEVDLELTRDPVMCETCLGQLQQLHHFRSACQDVEEKIVEFQEGSGGAAGPMDLHAVLQAAAAATPIEMMTVKEENEEGNTVGSGSSGAVRRRSSHKRVKVEPIKSEPVKEEEEDEDDESVGDEDEDMSEGNEEDLDDVLKQEELDIKSETGTSDSDNNSDDPSYNVTLVAAGVRHKCPQCEYQTCEKPLLELHIQRQHGRQIYKLRCNKCPFETMSEVLFTNHLAKIHGDTTFPLFKCNKCDYTSCSKFHLRRHECKKHLNRTTKEPFKCPHCPYVCHCMDSIKKHMRVHQERWFDCKECSFKGKTQQQLLGHQVEFHCYDAPFKCSHCSYVSYCMKNLLKHKKVHKEGRLDCKKCSFKGNTQQELLKHQVELHGYESPFKCPDCLYVSHCRVLLDTHMKVHIKGQFDCEKCSFKGISQQELVKHQVENHSDQLPFKCSHCQYESYSARFLRMHMRVHEEGWLNCEKCSFKGNTQQELVKHQADLHGYQPPFKCSDCSYVSHNATLLRRHMKLHKEGRFNCTKCSFGGISQQELVNHQVENHGYQLPFKCSKCEYCSFKKQYLLRHERNKHRDKPEFTDITKT